MTKKKINSDKDMIEIFNHILEGSKLFKVNVFASMNAIVDAVNAEDSRWSFYNKRAKYHHKKMNTTPERDIEDYKKISGIVAGMEKSISKGQKNLFTCLERTLRENIAQ
jgi:hypothetical protein